MNSEKKKTLWVSERLGSFCFDEICKVKFYPILGFRNKMATKEIYEPYDYECTSSSN